MGGRGRNDQDTQHSHITVTSIQAHKHIQAYVPHIHHGLGCCRERFFPIRPAKGAIDHANLSCLVVTVPLIRVVAVVHMLPPHVQPDSRALVVEVCNTFLQLGLSYRISRNHAIIQPYKGTVKFDACKWGSFQCLVSKRYIVDARLPRFAPHPPTRTYSLDETGTPSSAAALAALPRVQCCSAEQVRTRTPAPHKAPTSACV
jgi:hypothetical protein